MRAQTRVNPGWAALTVWGLVNVVNVLQAVGFFTRVSTGSRMINHLLGYGLIVLVIPATLALLAFRRTQAAFLQWAGPAVYLAFVVLMVIVDYVWPVEFRSPMRASILAPYLVLFFGAILLMGLPMYTINRRLWLVTVATTLLLLGSMGVAMAAGVG